MTLGFSALDWDCRRLLEPINAFPAEQYVLSPRSLPWDRIHIPVDLRPVGGGVQVVETFRNQPCGNILSQALSQAGVQAAPQSFLCRTSDGWFLPTAYVTLLPRGDSFQVWPLARVPTLRVLAGSNDRATTQDRFALSTLDSTPTDADFQLAAECNAVVLSPNGLFYVHAPAFTEHTSLRAAVLADYQHQHPQLSVTAFLRVLPPLASLPPIQFVAMQDADVEEPCLIDFRPIGGHLIVTPGEPGRNPGAQTQSGCCRYG